MRMFTVLFLILTLNACVANKVKDGASLILTAKQVNAQYVQSKAIALSNMEVTKETIQMMASADAIHAMLNKILDSGFDASNAQDVIEFEMIYAEAKVAFLYFKANINLEGLSEVQLMYLLRFERLAMSLDSKINEIYASINESERATRIYQTIQTLAMYVKMYGMLRL